MIAALLDRFAMEKPTCCAVCRRRAEGIGFGLFDAEGKVRVVHCCFDETCCRTVSRVAAMPEQKFDAFEQKALAEAGDEGGGYLDEIGKTDLATLSAVQWTKFLERVLGGFEKSMRRQMLEDEAPF